MTPKSQDRAAAIVNVGRLLGAAVVAGVLVAALALPAVGGAGITARNATQGFEDLDAELTEPPLPEKTILLDSTGKEFASFWTENRETARLDQVAPIMRQALIDIEDARFYEHGGLDAQGTIRALIKNLDSGGVQEGGSTLTQQYVKQVLYESAETEEQKKKVTAPTLARKLTELRLAMEVEKKYGKDQILEKYLNIAYFGASAYGIQAASKRFFGVTAGQLNVAQAATLAGAVQDPNDTDPRRGEPYEQRLHQRRNIVLDRMAELKHITPDQAAQAKALPLGLKITPIPGGCEESRYGFFCKYVEFEILNNPIFGKTPQERKVRWKRGGLIIKTTLDPKMQAAAEKAIRDKVDPTDSVVASEALVQPGTGAIKAIAVSKRFGPKSKKGDTTSINVAADFKHGGGVGFQSGSTAKVFTLATALKEGMRFNDGFRTPGSFSPSSGFRNCKGQSANDPNATILNASGEGKGGGYSLKTGTWGSVNIFFMMLEQKVGLCDTVNTARDLGIKRADGTPLREVPTFTLGANEMDPITVANAYAVFAAQGKYCTPMAMTEILERNGKRIAVQPQCKQVLDEDVAIAVSHILQGVFRSGTMRGQGIGRDVAGKTGTTDGYTAAWFAGITPNLAGAVSVGDTRGAFKYPLRGVRIGGRYYGSVQGAVLPGPIFVSTFRRALDGTEEESFPQPDFSKFGGGFTPGDEEDKKKKDPERPGGPGRPPFPFPTFPTGPPEEE